MIGIMPYQEQGICFVFPTLYFSFYIKLHVDYPGCGVPRVSILDVGSHLDKPFQKDSQVEVKVRRKLQTIAAVGDHVWVVGSGLLLTA